MLRRINLILSLRSMLQRFTVNQRKKFSALEDIRMLRCPAVRFIETCISKSAPCETSDFIPFSHIILIENALTIH
jgi:hypothetical protein